MCQRWLYRILPVEISQASDDECIRRQVQSPVEAFCRAQRVTLPLQAKPRRKTSNKSDFKTVSGRIILLRRCGSPQSQIPVPHSAEASISAEQSTKVSEWRRNDIVSKRYNLQEGKVRVYNEVIEPQDDDYLYCENCQDYFLDNCPVQAPPAFIKDTEVDKVHPNRAALTLPPGLRIGPSGIPDAGLGVWNEASELPLGVWFGPFEGQVTQDEEASSRGYAWLNTKGSNCYEYVDGEDKSCSNWMRYVNCAQYEEEHNLVAFQYHGKIFYRTCQDISPGCELLVWYGDEYAQQLGIKGVEMHRCSSCHRAFSRKKLLCLHVKHSHPSQIARGTSARNHLQSVEPCPEDQREQQKITDTQRGNDEDECQEIGKGTESLLKSMRERGPSRDFWTTPTEPKGSSSEGERILEEKPNSPEEVHQEDSGVCFVRGGMPRSVKIRFAGCGQGSSDGSLLKRLQNTCSGDRAYPCRECGLGFAGLSDVITFQETHSRGETYACKYCGLGYTKKSAAGGQKRTQSGKKPYVFREGWQRTTVKANRNAHQGTHAGRKHCVCVHCRVCCSSKSDLTLLHKAQSEQKCSTCGASGQGFHTSHTS